MNDIDMTGELGRRAQERLDTEKVVWLTTVRPDGTPEPNPVWFHWDGMGIVLRSQDNLKVRNIKANPNVALNFDSDGSGGGIVVIRGLARIAGEDDFAAIRDAYFAKYGQDIESLGMTPEGMAASYSVTIVIEPTRLRGF